MKQQEILTAINNGMVINKKATKMQNFVEVHCVRMAFVEILFVGIAFASLIISSHIITKSAIILLQDSKYNIFFAHTMLFWIFTLTLTLIIIPLLI